jgi:glyoxylase-like metal-dependent hydrolase (beta-lactamase superfamily II)
MRVELLSGGWFTSPAGLWRRGEAMDRAERLPVPAYVIEAAGERILVDTGLHPAAAEDLEAHYGANEALGVFELELERSVADQVGQDSISMVVLTHLHFDHAGGLSLLPPSVPVVVQRREWEAAHDPAAVRQNFYLPADYEAAADRVELVDGDHDLLGDGSVVLLSTPGHTPGHQSVRVGDGLVIGGDVVHFASGLDDHRFPVFGHDFNEQEESAHRLRALRDAGLRVLPGHDPDVLEPGVLAA